MVDQQNNHTALCVWQIYSTYNSECAGFQVWGLPEGDIWFTKAYKVERW